MNSLEQRLAEQLQALSTQGNRRELPTDRLGIDFWSNDYLGIARAFPSVTSSAGGATGSRLISGNRRKFNDIEAMIAHHHTAQAALVFSNGYAANLGLLSTLPQRGDTVLYDQLIHASLRDGIRLGNATAYAYRHNDLHQLEEKLARAQGQCFVVTESIFSMDGDAAPLLATTQLCERYGAALIVDEAHAAGLYGNYGAGLVSALQLEQRVFARVVTYGKAFGCHGAAVLGSRDLVDLLINRCRPFIYSTGLPEHSWNSIEASYEEMSRVYATRASQLAERIAQFRGLTPTQAQHPTTGYTLPGATTISSQRQELDVLSPIQVVICPGNAAVLALEEQLTSNGLLVKAIRHPTVAKGAERIRICLHDYNTPQEISLLTQLLIHAH